MINRSLARIRVFQALYAQSLNEGKTAAESEAELRRSLEETQNLYLFLLDLVPSLTALYTEQMERRKKRLIQSEEDRNPNMVLAENRLAAKIDQCRVLSDQLRERDLSWRRYDETLRLMLDELLSTKLYATYATKKTHTYKEDVSFWLSALTRYLFRSRQLDDLLQDINIYWDRSYDYTEKMEVEEMPGADELEQTIEQLKTEGTAYSAVRLDIAPVEVQKDFVLKTLKRTSEEEPFAEAIMPMYHDGEDESFPYELLRASLCHKDRNAALIEEFLENWDSDRLTACDTVLIGMGTAEMLTFPNIPISVTINEYVELAKAFSTGKSGAFVNGLLDKIAKKLNKQGLISKPV